ncbi:hypothetical protein ACOJBQ_004277, partial [Cronobacter muytjensii]
FSWFTRIRALPSHSSVIVAIAGLCATTGFRHNYVGIKWSSVRHVLTPKNGKSVVNLNAPEVDLYSHALSPSCGSLHLTLGQ